MAALHSFDYVAIAPDGRTLRGRVEAEDQRAAARRLQESGHLPMEVRPAGEGSAIAGFRMAGDLRLRPRELARLTRGLSLLLSAGLQLDLALEALAGSEAATAPRRILQGLHDTIRTGTPLSVAVAARPQAFPGWYGAAVATAEGTGKLPAVLDRLATETLRLERIAERIRASLVYPAVVLALSLAVMAVLVTVVLPALEPLFSAAGGQLPASTRFMLDASAWLREWGALGFAILLGLGLLALRALSSSEGRHWRDTRLLRLPLIGPLAWRAATARFTRLLGVLLSAGVPLTEALQHAGAAAGNAAMAAGLKRAGQHLSAGAGFAAALAREAVLPRLAITLIGIGEEGGRLREMLEEVAVIHEEEAERATERLLVLLVPGITLILGGLVAGMVLTTLNAILGANSAALGGP
ncbi:type II secretion system F family protein [Roseomonas marmotae]|uniref:General secretion pathway protein F n=1 Tax=Roseomonas marmotae TaxID=2768161 RepID=A0ABS3KC26_9PROT|nr:type II secretion system F family protein [Roseomonas marmotae]MBO1075024.1 type II secretion system F family protein [Roseomonas marmotae]QTI79941.1 type II secretion system F family protein [Roseomonas marmotae]